MSVKDYKELKVYQLAFNAAMEIFEISKTFPQEEKYSLTDQIRRASRSVCANIAEGWRKRRYEAVFINKLSDADTEAAETQVWLDFSLKCGYIREAEHKQLRDKYDHVCRQLYTIMKDAPAWCRSFSPLHASRASSVAQPAPLRDPCVFSDAPRSALHTPRASAFTLIEVLVAMTVLAIMVLLVANIFQGSSEAWNIGTQKADMNNAARAALDYMARELSCAVAGPIEKSGSGGAQVMTFRQEAAHDLRFLALANDPSTAGRERAIRGVFFYLDAAEYSLRAGRKVSTVPAVLDCYAVASPTSTWDSSRTGQLLITNVLSLTFYLYATEADLRAGPGQRIPVPPSRVLTNLPLCVDITLEILSDDDMRRYLQLGGADQTEFAARNSKLYTTRVYFPNRRGYGAR